MSEATKIQWASHTFNPWIGCAKVSPGCAHCYAEVNTLPRVKRSQGVELWGQNATRHRTSAATWRQPVRWNHQANIPTAANWNCCDDAGEPAKAFGPRPRVFPSLCDWLDDQAPIAWLADFLELIYETPHLDWLLLTKRPENFQPRMDAILRGSDLPQSAIKLAGEWLANPAPRNVWFGVSVEDQTRANERIPQLLKIPARVRFLSVEPLLGLVDIGQAVRLAGCDTGCNGDRAPHEQSIDWVIVGGESGPRARQCEVLLIRNILMQCRQAGVPCFVKQLGAQVIDQNDAGFDGDAGEWPMDTHYRELDTGYQGAPVRVLLKHPKGGDPEEWPEDLRVREFPTV